MARAQTRTNTAVAISTPIVLDNLSPAFKNGLAVDVTGTNQSSVQYSMDDPWASYATSYNADALWFDVKVPIDMSAVAADLSGELPYAARAVRLNTTAWTSGSAKLTVVPQSLL